nr:unnamed protein product [Digitaria exilis]
MRSLRHPHGLTSPVVAVLNLSLLALAAAALGPVLLLRPRPMPFGWAVVSVHAATLLTALAALCAHLAAARLRLAAYTAFALAALCCHALLAALCCHALLTAAFVLHRDSSLRLLESARDRREQLVLKAALMSQIGELHPRVGGCLSEPPLLLRGFSAPAATHRGLAPPSPCSRGSSARTARVPSQLQIHHACGRPQCHPDYRSATSVDVPHRSNCRSPAAAPAACFLQLPSSWLLGGDASGLPLTAVEPHHRFVFFFG